MRAPDRVKTSETRTIACFDFDGTLASRDNVVAYCRVVAGTGAVVRAMVAATPSLVAARRDPSRRDDAKAIVVRRALAGRRDDYLRDLGARYARLVVTNHMHHDVVARLDAHRAAGHELLIVSASLSLYLDPAAELLGVPTVLATEMEVGADGRLTGELAGANVRGPEKARRLDDWLAGEPAVVYAYGDSNGDRELFQRADYPVKVDWRGRIPASDHDELNSRARTTQR